MAEVDYRPGYPVMVNAEAETAYAAAAARKVSGQCDDAPLVMGAEDFSYVLRDRPGLMAFLGVCPDDIDDSLTAPPNHSNSTWSL